MSNWVKLKNNSKIKLFEIPQLNIDKLREEILAMNMRPIGFWGKGQPDGSTILYVVLADDANALLYVSSARFESGQKSYESITQSIPSFHIFEREFYEQFGIEPLNHPWLKGVRKNLDDYKFFEMEGEEVHQVAVGPIHAGVIEPGHFRFMCNGETVYHLEIMLGYQHRGAEQLILKCPSNQLAESICGDSVIGYNLAYSQIMETIKDINISRRAKLIRKAALEMERIAIHIGDMGAIAGDIAYLMGANVFAVTRTLVINTMLEWSGSRFGRGLITLGGVNFNLTEDLINRTLECLYGVSKTVERMTKIMLKNSSVMSRFEKTGVISCERAKEAGLVGMAARAAGHNLDSRFDFPDEITQELKTVRKPFKAKGDVNSRFKLRYKEIQESIFMIKKLLKRLKNIDREVILKSEVPNENDKDVFAISIVEGWRGEIVHMAITDSDGNLAGYKIKDPSFNNWFALALAVRNNGISDFPLCNKSFNLSYCGNDL